MDAEDALAHFVTSGRVDEDRGNQLIVDLVTRVKRQGARFLRASGEMVALPWACGDELLWHQLCQKQAFSLFCAWPKSGSTQDTVKSLKETCAVHTQVRIGA